jgi:hypothetical protein
MLHGGAIYWIQERFLAVVAGERQRRYAAHFSMMSCKAGLLVVAHGPAMRALTAMIGALRVR